METTSIEFREQYFLVVLFVFLLNPFLGCVMALSSLVFRDGIVNKRAIYFVLAIFMGMVAYTQYTKVGDLSRVYKNTIDGASSFNKDFFFVFQTKHILFEMVNQVVYYLTNNVRLITLIWVWTLYYFLFLSIDNIAKYKNKVLNGKELFLLLIASLFSFVIFTQVTELMKQGVATSLFLYSYSLFLLKKRWSCFLVFFLAANIHFSVLFFVPLFFTTLFSNKSLYIIFVLSFFMRQFDLMGMLTEYLQQFSGIGEIFLLGELANQVDDFHYDMTGFYSSGSFFFQFIYWHTLGVVMLVKLFKKDSLLANICLLMLCFLNLNYFSDHNYTRLLTMMFPFYIMLSFEIMELKMKNRRFVAFSILIIGAFLANYRMSVSRLLDASYSNTYMDGSLFNVFIYPSFMYFW